ncbi:MAG: hypothetical protein SFY92_08255 [Verrucomicrobiae bacterium]|nr:hypothetical protein [Verrucomicrobiae bacterium]
MKLSKEKIQSLVLAGMVFAGLVYVMVVMMILPWQAKIVVLTKKTEELNKKIKDAEAHGKRITDAEATAKRNEEMVKHFEADMPTTPIITFYPPLIKKEIVYKDIVFSQPSMVNLSPDLAVVGNDFKRIGWVLTGEGLSYHDLGLLMEKVENKNPLWEFLALEITENPNNQMKHFFKITFGTVTRK